MLCRAGGARGWRFRRIAFGGSRQAVTSQGASSGPQRLTCSIFMHGVGLQPAPWELCCCSAGIAGDGPLSAECRTSRLKPLAAWPTLLAAQVGRSYGSAREALLLNAKFVAAQLGAQQELNFDPASTPFINSLLAEVALPDYLSSHGMLTCRNPVQHSRTRVFRFDCNQN